MAKTQSIIQTLFHRRVPQIFGLYIGGTWMSIEIGDWVINRFGLDASLTSYIFIALSSFLPSVIVLAWVHGAPGKDKATRFEQLFVTTNVIIIGVILLLFRPPAQSASVTDTRLVMNEQGETELFEVPKQGYYKRVLTGFWHRDNGADSESWMDYGMPLMMARDLSQSPIVGADTFFSASALFEAVQQAGFQKALHVPVSLMLQVANESGYDYVVTGSWKKQGDEFLLHAVLYDVTDGLKLVELTEQGPQWIKQLEALSKKVAEHLNPENLNKKSIISHLSIAESMSTSLEAIQFWAKAKLVKNLDNNYPLAIEHLKKSVELDPSFALAYGDMGLYMRLAGNNEEGVKALENALRHDYKLSVRDRFVYRANSYAMSGETIKAIQVIKMWTEVQPESELAYRLLARNYMLIGEHEKDVAMIYQHLIELNPDKIENYLNAARFSLQQTEMDEALSLVTVGLEKKPSDYKSLILKGEIYRRMGRPNEAKKTLEQAVFISHNEIVAELAIINIDIQLAHLDKAQSQIDKLKTKTLTIRQKAELWTKQLLVYLEQGRINDAISVGYEIDEMSKEFMPPLLRTFTTRTQLASLYAIKNDEQEALKIIDELKAELEPPFDEFTVFGKIGVYKELEDDQGYETALKKIIELDSKVDMPWVKPFILYHQAWLLMKQDKIQKALETINLAYETMSKSILQIEDAQVTNSILVDKAIILERVGRRPEAIKLLQDLGKRYPIQSDAKLELAQLLMLNENYIESKRLITELLLRWNNADQGFRKKLKAEKMLAEIDGLSTISTPKQ